MAEHFSAASQRAIESFAATLGIHPQAGPDNSYGLAFSRSGVLSVIAAQDDRIVVCLAHDARRADASSHAAFVTLAGADLDLGTMVHAVKGENGALALAASIEEQDLTPQRLDEVVSKLMDVFAAILRPAD